MGIERRTFLREYERQLRAHGYSRRCAASKAGRTSTEDVRRNLAWWRVLRIYWRWLSKPVGSWVSPKGAGGKPATSDQTTLEGSVGNRRGKGAARQKRRPKRRADQARFH